MKRLFVVVIACVYVGWPALARDVFLIRGSASSCCLPGPPFDLVTWETDAVFFNKGAESARIRLISISNGFGTPAKEIVVPPRQSASLMRTTNWGGGEGLRIVHLSVPEEVSVESLLHIGRRSDPTIGILPPISRPYEFGVVHLPVFTSLVPAHEPQFHLGIFLGEIPSRINVGIYNAGTVQASATVEIRDHCDETLIERRSFVVPAETALQAFRFPVPPRDCLQPGRPRGSVYVVVTVDQPSLTFVSNISNVLPPTASVSVTATL